jgi:hypothetical protein
MTCMVDGSGTRSIEHQLQGQTTGDTRKGFPKELRKCPKVRDRLHGVVKSHQRQSRDGPITRTVQQSMSHVRAQVPSCNLSNLTLQQTPPSHRRSSSYRGRRLADCPTRSVIDRVGSRSEAWAPLPSPAATRRIILYHHGRLGGASAVDGPALEPGHGHNPSLARGRGAGLRNLRPRISCVHPLPHQSGR